MLSDHILLNQSTCPCDKTDNTPCNVCDGGLAICLVCGKAECELDEPCIPTTLGISLWEENTPADGTESGVCLYHCEEVVEDYDGWLPVDGFHDAIQGFDDSNNLETVLLLIPIEYTPCPSCNPHAWEVEEVA